MRRFLIAAAALAGAQGADAAPLDYAKPENWLCRPDANGPCDTDLSLTAVSAAGAVPVTPPAATAKFDCFYVYPTVSRQQTGNSDGTATDDERYVVQQQFARYGEVCRRFAPLYRQSTLGSIGGQFKTDGELAYADVKAAWDRYLAADNQGRGVLLVGHSQGSRHLTRLIAEEIAGKPIARRIVAAHLLGWPIAVPDPKAASAATPPPALPACTKATDIGCTVGYVTFLAGHPPAADNRFAGPPAAGLMVACVNPAALLGRAWLSPIMPANPRAAGSSGVTANLSPVPLTTVSYQLNGMVKGECVRGEGGTSFLAVSSPVERVQSGFERIDAGLPGWGLHLIDMNVALGDLVTLAGKQGAAWLGKGGGGR